MLATSACVIAGGPRQGLLAATRLSDLALGRPTRGGMSGEVGLSGGSVALSLRLTKRVSSMSTAVSEAELRTFVNERCAAVGGSARPPFRPERLTPSTLHGRWTPIIPLQTIIPAVWVMSGQK